MIMILPADYERLKHNWILLRSKNIGVIKLLRLDNLPALNISTNWGEGESALGDLASSLQSVADFGQHLIYGKSINQGFVRAKPSSWGGGSKTSFTINTIVTSFSDSSNGAISYPHIGTSNEGLPTGSIEDINKLIEMTAPSRVDNKRYYAPKGLAKYAKFIPIEVKHALAAGGQNSNELELADLKFDNLIDVIKGVDLDTGNSEAINAGSDEDLISISFGLNDHTVMTFKHSFVPTNISVEPAPVLITYLDSNKNKQYALPYYKVSITLESLAALTAENVKLTEVKRD